MTEESLLATLRALDEIGYQGAISLELSAALMNPAKALQDSRDALLRAIHRALALAPADLWRRAALTIVHCGKLENKIYSVRAQCLIDRFL